jgi:hypothetical protein
MNCNKEYRLEVFQHSKESLQLLFDKPVKFNFAKQKLKYSSFNFSSFNEEDKEVIIKELAYLSTKSEKLNFVSYRTSDLKLIYPELLTKEKSVLKNSNFIIFISHYEGEINLKFYEKWLMEKINIEEVIQNTLLNQNKESNCDYKRIYHLNIPKNSVNYVKDFFIDSDILVHLVIEKKCKNDFSKLIKETKKQVSLSLVSLFILNYLKLYFLNILNSKEMVDIIFLNKIKFDSNIQEIFSFFESFLCVNFHNFFSKKSSFDSNYKVRSFFYQTEGKFKIY